jgi:ribosomal protein S18 acetylase RimI-like enzyme
VNQSNYVLVPEPPDAMSYMKLREVTGLSRRSPEAAEVGLAGTWFGVHVNYGGQVVGMGRVIGDGGSFFQIVDVAVDPEHQGRGLGQQIMSALMAALRARAPKTAQVSLLADGAADRLYEKFGFRSTAPDSIGMLLQL